MIVDTVVVKLSNKKGRASLLFLCTKIQNCFVSSKPIRKYLYLRYSLFSSSLFPFSFVPFTTFHLFFFCFLSDRKKSTNESFSRCIKIKYLHNISQNRYNNELCGGSLYTLH